MPRRGRPRHPSLLTPGEQRVLQELREGGTNAEIAVRLGLSPETVKTHIASMLSKLELRDRGELAAWEPQEANARRLILGLLRVPSGPIPLKAPLVWAGAVLGGATAIAAAAIFVAAMLGNDDQPIAVPVNCDTIAEATPLHSTTAHGTGTPELHLIVVSDGSHDALLLEWVGGPEDATRWQYRLRRHRDNAPPLEWEAWTDVPDSTANTCGYRVTGLREGTAYGFQVRAVVGPPGVAEAYSGSPTSETGATHLQGELPGLQSDRVGQGDGVTEWVIADFTIVIPAGMRVTTASPKGTVDGNPIVSVFEVASRSVLQFTLSGDLVEWHVYSPVAVRLDPHLNKSDRVTPLSSNLNTLFEQIVASVRPLAPAPATPEPAALVPPAPSLLVYSDGSADALWIEWRGRSEGVTGWQILGIGWEDGRSFPWKDWVNIPTAAATTGRYRVTGLTDDIGYELWVRPLRGESPGEAVHGYGITNSRGGLARLRKGIVAEGDGSRKWKPYGDFLITIPAGMRVRGGGGSRESYRTSLSDIETGSRLVFMLSGEEWSRTIHSPHVNALFDQIVASVQHCWLACMPPQTLRAFSDGAPDSLLLEWGRGDYGGEQSTPDGLTGWQYRLRSFRVSPGGWSEWTDFPEITGSSRRGRVSGLRPETLYQFEVRAVVGASGGATPGRTSGYTQSAAGLRAIPSGHAVEGDGRTEWRLTSVQIVVIIPAGMLVADDGQARGGLRDLDSGSWLSLDPTTGTETGREIVNAVEGGRDVDALFDQIVASARVVGYR